MLNYPMRVVHPEGECDEDMQEVLHEYVIFITPDTGRFTSPKHLSQVAFTIPSIVIRTSIKSELFTIRTVALTSPRVPFVASKQSKNPVFSNSSMLI